MRPIERGWNLVLENAPNQEERDKAKAYRTIFYGGASWLWEIVKDEIDDDLLRAKIEDDFARWRKTR
jgi:hypothetical protein